MTPPTLPPLFAALAVVGALTLAFLLAACVVLPLSRAIRRRRVLAWLGVDWPRWWSVLRRWWAEMRYLWRLGGMRAEDYDRIAPRPPHGPPCAICGRPIWRNFAHRIHPMNHDDCNPARDPKRLTSHPTT